MEKKAVIAVLGGAGMMGQGVIRDLLSDRAVVNVGEVKLFDSNRERMVALRDQLNDPRLSLHDLNVGDPQALARSLEGADICVNSIPTLAGYQMDIFAAALAAKVDYVDLGGLGTYTVKQLKWHEQFRAAGVVAVLGVGADPGMSNVICRAVADQLDEIDSINLYWAATLTGAENPVLVPPYSVSTVLAEYAHPCLQFLDGRHVECEPQTGKEVIDLPEPWGRCEFMYSIHSEQLTVPLADGIREKGIKEFTWKLHLPKREHEAWVGLVKAGFGDFDRPVEIQGTSVRPLDVLNAVIERNIAENANRIPAQQSSEIHFAIGRGRVGGQAATARCEVIVRAHPMYEGYVDAATSMNASIAVQLMLRDERRPGVYAPEAYFDAKAYFVEAEKRHFAISVTRTIG